MAVEPELQKYHRGNVRADLIDMALIRLRSQGVSSLTLTGLAQAIGVSPPAVYNHFRNKEALIAAVAAEGFRQLVAALQQALDLNSEDGRKHAFAIAYVSFAEREFALYRLLFRDEIDDRRFYPALADGEAALFKLIGLLHYGRIDRRKRVQDYPQAVQTWATLHGLASLVSDRQIVFRNKGELKAIAMAAVDQASSGF